MRSVGGFAAFVAIALTVAGCDPVTERRYITEGAGVDLYTSDGARQLELESLYVDFVCRQNGLNCAGNWAAFVQAAMNDIDRRCDGYLTWLDARRRDREPVIAQLSALNTATHAIMTVSGASPKSLDIVTAAFGLASATYTNWNSRLLLAVNQSTVQEVVYTSQGQFREKTKNYPVPDRPTAIYLLRNYLRLCTPITIEANINTSTTLVQRGAPVAAGTSTVVRTVQPTHVIRTVARDDSYTALRAQLFPGGSRTPDAELVAYVRKLLGNERIAIGPILTDARFVTLRRRISACIVSRAAGSPCPDGSLSQFVQ